MSKIVLSPVDPRLRRCRWMLGFFIFGLVVSGLTAFPLLSELELLTRFRGVAGLSPGEASNGLDRWLLLVREGLRECYSRHPWIAYGTDWLAFAHLVLAIFFIGPLVDPVRNVWVLYAGLVACVLVIPLALVCGYFRQIPLEWRLLDCSFGLFGAVPLLYCLRQARALADSRTA